MNFYDFESICTKGTKTIWRSERIEAPDYKTALEIHSEPFTTTRPLYAHQVAMNGRVIKRNVHDEN